MRSANRGQRSHAHGWSAYRCPGRLLRGRQIDVIRQEAHNRYVSEASIATAPRARTGLFVAAERTLYVAAPAVDGRSAHVDVCRVE